MKNFDYVRPATIPAAIAAAAEPNAVYLAGGTNLLDLMKGGVTRPDRVVDVSRLPGLDRIEFLPDGSVRIGALVRNADLARNPDFAKSYPAIAEALLSGASGQLRNAATVGGNLLQRTRCGYFSTRQRLQQAPAGLGLRRARRREPSSCRAGLERGLHRHPSVGFLRAAGGARRRGGNRGPNRPARGRVDALHCLPGETPERDSVLERGDLIVALRLPKQARASRRTSAT